MDHVMDGAPVAVGDTVYDVVLGTGEVVELKVEGRFRVRFATGAHVFDGNGKRVDARHRTLYWHNPIVTIPEKDEVFWHEARRLCMALTDELRRMRS